MNFKRPRLDLLTNSHLNTILPVYLTQLEPNYVRERIDIPDGDFIDLDWVNPDIIDAPTFVLFHGLEGNSRSHYAKRIMYYLEQQKWRGVVVHFRGCSEEINRLPRAYHAGDTFDLEWILGEIRLRTPHKLFAAGVSLGGNILLKYLGEKGALQNIVDAAMAVSVPFDLAICNEELERGFNKHVYVKHFMDTLLPKMQHYAKNSSKLSYAKSKIQTFSEFNDTFISPMFDFKDNEDYCRSTSCRQYLIHIATPTLILQAKNDPMVPLSAWPTKEELSPYIRFVGTKTGGHAGFLSLTRNYKQALLKFPKILVDYCLQFVDDD